MSYAPEQGFQWQRVLHPVCSSGLPAGISSLCDVE
jgi:hypothetical protein